MAVANLKSALKVEKIKEFGGICHGGSMIGKVKENGCLNAFDIRNFRILPDGSLEKREGYAHVATLDGEPRAFWSGYLDGDEMTFALVDSTIYTVDIDRGRSYELGEISSSEGRAEFFFYRGMLYLVDGYDFYRYDGEEFTSFSGYVPLYGKGLNGEYGQEIYEPINFLSDKIRIHYKLSKPVYRLWIGVECDEMIYFKYNGVDHPSDVVLSDDGMKIEINFLMADDVDIEVCLRLAPSSIMRDKLLGVTRGTVYGGADDGRILLYGGSDASRLFVSREVSHASFLESLAADSSSSEVYFPITDTVSVTDGRYPITALCRHYDRLLIFTERETWMADFTKSDAEPYIVPINSSVGCLSESGAVLGGNSPYTVSEGGIYRWTAEDDERNECNAVCISGEISDMLEGSFFDHAAAFYNRERGEVWFADPDSEEQNVFIYSVPTGKWYRFDGIPVDSFFSFRGKVCTLYGKYIFAFSEDNLLDGAIGGKISSYIEAYYESNVTDFDLPERTKRLARVLLKADCDGYPFSLTLEGDMGGKKELEISEGENDNGKYPTHFDAHSGIGRFREMNYTVRSIHRGRTRVMGLTLSVKK